METTPEKYRAYVRQKQKKSPLGKDMALAFLIGGLICVLGQLISDGYIAAGLPREEAATATSVSLVFLSALLTGLNLYHRLARYGGAGTLVPITGFANAVVSPAIDFKAEGIITGIRPAVAQTMVGLGVDMARLLTLGNLQQALMFCMSRLGGGAQAVGASPPSGAVPLEGKATRASRCGRST